MGKLILDIEHTSNNTYVITWYKTTPSTMQKLAGVATEKETLAFSTAEELTNWIKKVC